VTWWPPLPPVFG